jgi:hypothetical protein
MERNHVPPLQEQKKRFVTMPEFVEITNITFGEFNSLYHDGKIAIIKRDGQSFVDLETLVGQQENDKELQ